MSVMIAAVSTEPTGGAVLKSGEAVTSTPTTSAAAEVAAGSGGELPELVLSNNRRAMYDAAASGGTKLVFTDMVGAGQDTSDLDVTGLNPNGATITGTGGTSTGALPRLAGSDTGPVIDTTAPVLGVGAAPTGDIEATSAQGAAVDFAAVTAVDAMPTLTYTDENGHPVTSGQTFGSGAHTITVTATDDAGNRSTETFGFGIVGTTSPTPTGSAVRETTSPRASATRSPLPSPRTRRSR